MGFNDPVLVDEKVADSGASLLDGGPPVSARGRKYVDLIAERISRFAGFFGKVKMLPKIIESEIGTIAWNA